MEPGPGPENQAHDDAFIGVALRQKHLASHRAVVPTGQSPFLSATPRGRGGYSGRQVPLNDFFVYKALATDLAFPYHLRDRQMLVS